MEAIATNYKLLEPKQKYTKAFCTDEDIALAEQVRAFVNHDVMPRRNDLEGGWHRDEELALATLHDLYRKAHQLGITKLSIPESYGGIGASAAARMIVLEELSRGDIGFANMIAKVAWVVSITLAARRKDLMEELAPKFLADPPYTVCVAITEQGGGANIEDPAFEFRTLRTTARLEGDEWVISGHKIWPGPGGPNDHFRSKDLAGHLGYWTVATTDPNLGPAGVGLFYVPPDAEGLTFGKPSEKLGQIYTDENVEIWYDDVRIPKRYRIDTEPGQGANILTGYIVGYGRLSGAPCLTGVADAALEIVLDWTGERKIAGVPVRERSAFAMMLAEMYRSIDISRQYYLSVTWQATQRDYGRPWSKEMLAKFSSARSFAADTAEMVTNRAMELMGAAGYAYGFQIEKYLRDFKMVKMWLGGAQRDRLDVAQGLYGHFRWPGMSDF